jgi:ABC-type Fe3+ transport system substrate-binding protein
MLQIMGREKGLNYMRALAKQKPAVRRESTAMRAQLVLAGESDVDIDSTYSVLYPLMSKGAPVNWTTLGPALVVPVAYGLATKAKCSAAWAAPKKWRSRRSKPSSKRSA